MAAAQRGLLADHPGLERMPVLSLAYLLGPGTAHPRPVGGQVLDVAGPEVAGDLVQGIAAMRRVPGIANPDLVQDRGVPGLVERGRGEVGRGLAAGQLVQELAEAQLVERAAELIEPGQLPGGFLVGRELGKQRPGVLGQPYVVPQHGQLPLGLGYHARQLGETRREPRRAAVGGQFLPVGELGGSVVQRRGQLFAGRLCSPGPGVTRFAGSTP